VLLHSTLITLAGFFFQSALVNGFSNASFRFDLFASMASRSWFYISLGRWAVLTAKATWMRKPLLMGMWLWQAFIIRVIIGFSTFSMPPKDRGPAEKKWGKKGATWKILSAAKCSSCFCFNWIIRMINEYVF